MSTRRSSLICVHVACLQVYVRASAPSNVGVPNEGVALLFYDRVPTEELRLIC